MLQYWHTNVPDSMTQCQLTRPRDVSAKMQPAVFWSTD
jgi:hypothetical protein